MKKKKRKKTSILENKKLCECFKKKKKKPTFVVPKVLQFTCLGLKRKLDNILLLYKNKSQCDSMISQYIFTKQ